MAIARKKRPWSERVKAQDKIQETSKELRLLAAHLQDMREEERATMAREIHDELGQQLTGLKMDIYWRKDGLLKEDTENYRIAQNKYRLVSYIPGMPDACRATCGSQEYRDTPVLPEAKNRNTDIG